MVLKNNYLGLVREYQHYSLNDRYEMVKLGTYPRLSDLARAYDIDYYLADGMVGLDEKIKDFLSAKNQAIMEVTVDANDTVK